MSDETLYQRIGGESAVQLAVDRFYQRVLADRSLSHFFTGANMGRLKAHQFAFLSQVLGGPRQYSGASMSQAHAHLAIEQHHFDSVALHLVETLKELRVPAEIIGEITRELIPLSDQIVNIRSHTATV